MLCVTSFDRLPRACAKQFAALIRRAQSEGARVVITPQPLYGVAYHDFGSGEVRCYNIDASTTKTMLRANNGMVLLRRGVIRAKRIVAIFVHRDFAASGMKVGPGNESTFLCELSNFIHSSRAVRLRPPSAGA